MSVIIYDNFYIDPDSVRKEILANTFEVLPNKVYYGGKISKQYSVPDIHNFFSTKIGAQSFRRVDDKSYFGECRLSFKDDFFEQWIHTDESDWSAVVFLNLEGTYPESHGTAIWRHRETGWTTLPLDSSKETRTRLIKDGLDESKWELIEFIPGKYNRIVLFPSMLWHSMMPRDVFGIDNESARLAQLFFFDELR